MAIELDLRQHLLTVADVVELVENIFIDLSPQKSPLPRIVLRLMPGGRREYHSLGPTDLVFADIECTIQANAYETCTAIYEAIREELDLMRGSWGDATVECSRVTPAHSQLNLPGFGDESGVPALVCTIEVSYREE